MRSLCTLGGGREEWGPFYVLWCGLVVFLGLVPVAWVDGGPPERLAVPLLLLAALMMALYIPYLAPTAWFERFWPEREDREAVWLLVESLAWRFPFYGGFGVACAAVAGIPLTLVKGGPDGWLLAAPLLPTAGIAGVLVLSSAVDRREFLSRHGGRLPARVWGGVRGAVGALLRDVALFLLAIALVYTILGRGEGAEALAACAAAAGLVLLAVRR